MTIVTDTPTFLTWRKSSHSGGGDNCVEVSFDPEGYVGVRDSKNPNGGHLTFSAHEWQAFHAGVRDGEFS
ncbi:DUF397 domain-containing protein [Kineosporia sp. NBRC 101677]|uniref:DUF397 domain-containing protein n=1 Tax=Kineosporia sp. NBRC 101677 TaxID=3032197 RepID=UPI0024A0E086|nr:DUF397 domain-containing protein [Kineosporia sp. NBRC 101677]